MREQLSQRPIHFMGAVQLSIPNDAVTAIDPTDIPNGASGVILANGVGAGNVHWVADSRIIVSPPVNLVVSLGVEDDGGVWGEFGTGIYFYVVTATAAGVETTKSLEVSVDVDVDTKRVTLTWVLPDGADGVKVYRGTSAGVYTNKLRATLGAVKTYIDDGGAVGAGTPPVTNSTLFPNATFGASLLAGESLMLRDAVDLITAMNFIAVSGVGKLLFQFFSE